MAIIKVTWAGASDDTGIQGYELSYKKSTDSTWIIEPFITTPNTFGEYEISGALPQTLYNIRVRTKDIDDLWSIDYAITDVLISNSFGIKRTLVGIKDDIPGVLLCSTAPLVANCFIIPEVQDLAVGDVVYNDSLLEDPFDGDNRYWNLTGGLAYKIGNDGVIEAVELCEIPIFEYFRSLGVSLSEIEPCGATLVEFQTYSIVELDLLAVGDTLWQDAGLTIPLVGNDLVITVGTDSFITRAFQVNNSGEITALVQDCN